MIELNDQEKREELKEILLSLSKSQDVLKNPKDRAEYFLRFEKIYHTSKDDNFRHYYSDIFAILTLIDGDSSIGSLEVLAQNIQTIKDGYQSNQNKDEMGKPIDISREIKKLFDHTNLDISRLNYTKRITSNTQSELSKAKLLIGELNDKVNESQDLSSKYQHELLEQSKKLSDQIQEGQKRMQNEYVTILGIFAAIVLAFTGGMTFSSSVLQNINQASIYRITGITLIIGIILFNLIWLLIDFIRDINGKSIRKKWIPILANIIFICGIIGTIWMYKSNWFSNPEGGNIQVNKTEQQLK